MMDGAWDWWGPGLLLMAICMVAMAWMMMGHHRGARDSHEGASHGEGSEGAERILAARLARGEIDVDEYERRMSALRQAARLENEGARHDL